MLNEKKKPRKHLPCKSASAAGFEANPLNQSSAQPPHLTAVLCNSFNTDSFRESNLTSLLVIASS